MTELDLARRLPGRSCSPGTRSSTCRPTELPAVLAELARVLRPGGHLLVAFQVGDEPVQLREAYGHQVSLVVHRRLPDLVIALLADAGLVVHTRLIRDPRAGEEPAGLPAGAHGTAGSARGDAVQDRGGQLLGGLLRDPVREPGSSTNR